MGAVSTAGPARATDKLPPDYSSYLVFIGERRGHDASTPIRE